MEIKNRQLPAEGMATDQYKMWGREQCASKMWTVNNSVTNFPVTICTNPLLRTDDIGGYQDRIGKQVPRAVNW